MHRFDEMAVMVNDRIDDPAEAGVERYVGLEHLDSESLTIRRWGSPSDVEATKLRFRSGDIIFGRRRVYQRKLAVADFDGICSAHAMVLRARPEVALSEFLPFFMRSDLFMERAKEISVGSLSPTINWKTLAREEFALPSLGEQQELVVVLGAIKRAIHTNSALLRSADGARASYANAVFSDRPDRVSRGRGSESDKGHRWRVLELRQLVEPKGLVRGPFGGSLKKAVFVEHGYQVYEQSHAINGDLSNGRYFVTEEKFREMDRFQVEEGDLIMSCSGTIGRAALLTGDSPCGIINQALLKIRPDRRKVDPRYLLAFLRSEVFASSLARLSMGSAMSNVTSVRQLERITVPVPSTAVQRQIANTLDQQDTALACISERLKAVRRLLDQVTNEALNPAE